MPACSPPSSPDTARRQWLASAIAVPGLGLVGCATPAAPVPPVGDNAAWGQPWHMPGVRYMDLPAPALPGRPMPRQHRVMVYVPQGPAPAAGWPVVYVLDGNLMFPLLAQLVHNRGARGPELRSPGAIVVGLGHALPPGSAEVHDRAARTYDYTLPYDGVAPDSQGRAQGGADQFLDWMAQQLQPRLQAAWPLAPQRQTLVGHSYGGLFTLHALFTRTALFQRYVAASPSLWWGNGTVLEEATQFLRRHQAGASALPSELQVYLSQGGEELAGRREPGRAPNPEREASARQAQTRAQQHGLATVADLSQALDRLPRVRSHYQVWPGANHGGTQLYACLQAARVGLDWDDAAR